MLDLSMLILPDSLEAGSMIMTAGTLLTRDAKLDDEVWHHLVKEKHDGRYRSINDYLRYHFGIDKIRSPGSVVKNYADQSLNEGVLIDTGDERD